MRSRRRGHSVMEFALFLPFLIFLFVGAFDWGFYAWALISTQNAARVAALYTSTSTANASDSAGACIYAIAELSDAPNIASMGPTQLGGQSGPVSGIITCNAAPLVVTAVSVAGPDSAQASQVTVTYQTPVLIPIPLLLSGQMSITRVVEMRVKS